jgi:hydroxymethylpyrimidine/phosphomethylpyrimidine kinase
MQKRPYIISIAGFDPSAGAGILSDCKTFENLKVYGFGVCSALTLQTDKQCKEVKWLESTYIIQQIKVLLDEYNIHYFKIGIINNLTTLSYIITYIASQKKEPFIVWDPVIKAEAGYSFHENWEKQELEKILQQVNLITPNTFEWNYISNLLSMKKENLSKLISYKGYGAFLLKGGHNTNNQGCDYLYTKNKRQVLEGKPFKENSKHGTGCVLSSAVTAYLAKGFNLIQSCIKAKEYTEQFIISNNTRLGYHTCEQ